MTQFEDGFRKAGLPRHENDFSLALARFLNSGGTIERAFAIVDAAAIKMGKSGQSSRVQQDQNLYADLSRPTPSEGHPLAVQQDQIRVADARQSMPNADQRYCVHQDPCSAVSVGRPLPEGQGRPVQQDQTPAADGHPIPSEGHLPPAHQGPSKGANAGKPIASTEGHNAGAQQGQRPVAPVAREPSEAYRKAMGESRRQAAQSILYRYTTSEGKFWGDVKPYEVGTMMRDSLRGQHLMTACGALNPKQMKMTFAELLRPEQARIAMEKADKELINAATV